MASFYCTWYIEAIIVLKIPQKRSRFAVRSMTFSNNRYGRAGNFRREKEIARRVRRFKYSYPLKCQTVILIHTTQAFVILSSLALYSSVRWNKVVRSLWRYCLFNIIIDYYVISMSEILRLVVNRINPRRACCWNCHRFPSNHITRK